MEEMLMSEVEKYVLCNKADFNFNDTLIVIFIAVFKSLNKDYDLCDYEYLAKKYLTWMKTEGLHWVNEFESIDSLALAMLFIKDFEIYLNN